MRIACLVSHHPGHLDFGGGGFLRLTDRLLHRGHRVSWFAGSPSTDTLVDKGHSVAAVVPTELIVRAALARPADDATWSRACDAIHSLRRELQQFGPDCLLADRGLTVTAAIAASLSRPYAAIGTPGGIWARLEHGMVPVRSTVEKGPDLSRRLRARLDWFDADMNTEWLRSPVLNVSFMGRSFYAESAEPSSAFVRLFGEESGDASNAGDRLGFAFGHSGVLEALQHALADVLEKRLYPAEKIDVFLGGRPHARTELLRSVSSGVRVHGWEDYRRAFAGLRGLVTFGGIGTLWHGIDRNLPMLVVPGRVGDQWYNGGAIEREGMGLRFDGHGAPPISAVLETERWHEHFDRFKKGANFSDDLDSVCERIEAL